MPYPLPLRGGDLFPALPPVHQSPGWWIHWKPRQMFFLGQFFEIAASIVCIVLAILEIELYISLYHYIAKTCVQTHMFRCSGSIMLNFQTHPVFNFVSSLNLTWHPAAQVKGVDGFGFAENFTTPDHHKPWILMKLFPCCVYVWSRQMLAILGHFVFLAQVHEQHATSIQDKRGRKYQVCFVSTRVHWEWGLQSVDFLLGILMDLDVSHPNMFLHEEWVSSWNLVLMVLMVSCGSFPIVAREAGQHLHKQEVGVVNISTFHVCYSAISIPTKLTVFHTVVFVHVHVCLFSDSLPMIS